MVVPHPGHGTEKAFLEALPLMDRPSMEDNAKGSVALISAINKIKPLHSRLRIHFPSFPKKIEDLSGRNSRGEVEKEVDEWRLSGRVSQTTVLGQLVRNGLQCVDEGRSRSGSSVGNSRPRSRSL